MEQEEGMRRRITKRDRQVITWVGEQYTARVDQIQLLMGNMAGKPTKHGKHLSLATTEQRIKAWVDMGLVVRKKQFYREPAWVWSTAKGLQLLEHKYRYQEPRLHALQHFYWVNQARLYVEEVYKETTPFEWVSERLLRADVKESEGHSPDGVLQLPEGKIAIEVELNAKAKSRLEGILQYYLENEEYQGVTYFCPPLVQELVQAQLSRLPEEKRVLFSIRSLDSIKNG